MEEAAVRGDHGTQAITRDRSGLGAANALLDDLDAVRRHRCGHCDGEGQRWSLLERAWLPCPVCKGDGRGSLLVEPGPVRDDVALGELADEYRRLVRARSGAQDCRR